MKNRFFEIRQVLQQMEHNVLSLLSARNNYVNTDKSVSLKYPLSIHTVKEGLSFGMVSGTTRERYGNNTVNTRNIWLSYNYRFLAIVLLLFTLCVGQIWADVYFSDNFSNVGSNANSYTSRTGWTLSNTYAHYNSGIRLGTNGGYATKTAMSSISGSKDIQVTVYVANWNNDAANLVVTVNGTAKIDGASSKTIDGIVKTSSTSGAVTWSSSYLVSFEITGATSTTTIKFGTSASGKRLILGPIRISAPGEDCGIFYESWDKTNGTGGNDGSWSGSIATASLTADNSGWTNSSANGAKQCAKFGTGSAKGSAQTPAIAYTGGKDLILTFKAAAWNGSSEGTTLNLSATNATLDKSSVTLTKGAWTTYTVNLSSVTTNFNIKWEAKNTSNNRFFLDDVCISEVATPSCSAPTGLNNGSVTSNSATLSVTSAAANYQFYYSTSSTAPTSSTSPTATVSSAQSKNITGLSYGTTYYYWARHDCGGSSYSDWVAGSENTFTTTAPAPTSVAAGSITMSGATLTISDSYSPASYDIYYSTSSTAPTSGTTATATSTTKSKELTGLTSGQTYYYWVRGVGPNAKSSWVAGDPTTFTTVSLSSIEVQTAPTKTVYLAGETFDPTGLVIIRKYSNSTSDTYTYAGHTGDFTFTPSTSTALTKSNTAVTISYGGKTVSQSITVYGVTLNVQDDAGNAIRSGGPSAPTRTGTSLTPAANAGNYVWWKWLIDGATLGSAATTKSNTITSPTGDVTVTAVYYAPRTVTWMVNKESWTPGSGGGGGTNGTAEVARGTKWNALILPSDPTTSDGCGDKFIGWTSSEISGKLNKDDDAAAITTLYNNLLTSDNKSSKTTAINNNIVFHAVFADYAE